MSEKRNKEEILRSFIDGELSEEEEIRALHQIAEDPDMRDMLRFERSLFFTLQNYPSDTPQVPEHFADSVMDKIEEKRSEEPVESIEETPVFERFKKILEEALAPKHVSFRPVWVLAVVLIIGYLTFTLPGGQVMDPGLITQANESQTPQMVTQQEEKVWVRFVYFDDDAENISVAGDFSNWEPVELTREVSGDKQVWTGMIQATRGEQRYMFVKDEEEWITDPFAEIQRDDGFGNKNAVIYL
jgi:hypothetical protein